MGLRGCIVLSLHISGDHSMNLGQDFLRHALKIDAFLFGDFSLNSGRPSPYFFKSTAFCNGLSLWKIAWDYCRLLNEQNLVPNTVLFGPPYKGTLLVPAISLMLYREFNMDVSFASGRKESKLHGEQGQILGNSLKDKDVVVIDDTLTAGKTAEGTLAFLSLSGARVKAYVVAFDRQEREESSHRSAARGIEEQFDVPVYSIATLRGLISLLEGDDFPEAKQYLPSILAHQAKFGAQ